MSSFDQSGISSPDPLATSPDGSFPLKSKSRRTPPRKALSTTTGNAQSHQFHITTPKVTAAEQTSPSRSGKGVHQDLSPWRIQVIVQAEQTHPVENHHEPQTSPSKKFTERTFTTKVPIKDGDEPPIVHKKSRGTPRKPRSSRGTSKSPSRSPGNVRSKGNVRSPNKTASADSPSPAKRGRGRPRKSTEGTSEPLSNHQNLKPNDREYLGRPSVVKAEDLDTVKQAKTNGQDVSEGAFWDVQGDVQEYDSVLDSEGFSMVSVSSIPSAQGKSNRPSVAITSSRRVTPCAIKRNITPSKENKSPRLPPPPKPAPSEQGIREIEKPTEGTPRLTRVVRAGVALQGVLDPGNSDRSSPTMSRRRSSPLNVATSPKDRLDKLFNGFGPATQRELRAGLRLGEELARRQTQTTDPLTLVKVDKDIFGSNPEISYPRLPDPATGPGFSLAPPSSGKTGLPPSFNAQLPSPSGSDVNADDDRMSWKFDTMHRNEPSPLNLGSIGGKTVAVDETMLARQAEWQREREAISKEIENANASQVIVIDDSDDENPDSQVRGPPQVPDDADADIWQEEAHNSANQSSSTDVPPVFLQQEPKKPRRSQLPSPWMRKSQDVSFASAEASHEDLFWQPREASVTYKESGCPEISDLHESGLQTPPSSEHSLSKDGAESTDNAKPAIRNPSKHPEPSTPLCTKDRTDQSEPSLQQVVIQTESSTKDWPEISVRKDGEKGGTSAEPEDIDTTILNQNSMLGDATGPLDEGSELDVLSACMNEASTTGSFEEVPEPETPLPTLPSPKSSLLKHVRFTDEVLNQDNIEDDKGKEIPLPPAPSSWFSRAISFLLTLGSSIPTTVPLPASPKRIIQLSQVDKGPLPLYMPWTPSHWWALIHISRQLQSGLISSQPLSMATSANYLGTVVSMDKWSKKITKQDCAVIERFLEVLVKRGTVKGVEAVAAKGGISQWRKVPGQWIDQSVIVSALVSQWACDIQDGICTAGWSDRTGLKSGSKTEMWTKADLPVDGPSVAYEL
ncbi:MAG: hypothetical protein Q9222_006583 [Ikaeria aurantiellina]